jgi:galactokinase
LLVEAPAENVARRFRARFGDEPRVYRAPGRVNLIGEHTDYNDGFVLPAAVTRSCWVAAVPRDDRRIVIGSENVGQEVEWSLDEADPPPRAAWSSYALGVAAVLRRRGERLRGATILVHSDVPMGAGLSSSASFEVAVGTALCDLSDVEIGATEMARLCQQAEIEFTGARCGIMDQFVACHARAQHALLLDCRSLEHEAVPLPDDVRLVACNTMVRHAHAGGEYNRRRSECESAVAHIAALFPEVRSLRDIDLARLEACRGELPDAVYRRSRHVVTENNRVLSTVRALRNADFDAIDALMFESHQSLRNDYEVSCPELDAMVDIARSAPGVLGTRMTGGGFGGCTVSLVRNGAVDDFRQAVASRYEAQIGRRPEIYVLDAADAATRW